MSERLVCNSSPWFKLRAVAMLAMFTIFAVLFFRDAMWGYKEKNLAWYTHKAFEQALSDFPKNGHDAGEWAAFTKGKTIDLGNDPSLLPAGTLLPMPWPRQLTDYERIKSAKNLTEIYDEFRTEAHIDREPDEHSFDKQKILEQWVVFGVSTVAAVATLFFLIRNLQRSMALDATTLYPPGGAPVAISDLVRLDLRKWYTKGVAFAFARQADGTERKIRLDGFVYGGFKKDQGEPAEAFMQKLKASFSGEILQYVVEEPAPAEAPSPEA